ncbi:MAG: hypothetical protein WBV60_14070 [Terriglobales bacterium]
MLVNQTHFLSVQLVTLPSRIFEDYSHAEESARNLAVKTKEPVFIVRFEDQHGAAFFCLATSEQISTPANYQTSISVVKAGQS